MFIEDAAGQSSTANNAETHGKSGKSEQTNYDMRD
jgi:hypothetical protein